MANEDCSAAERKTAKSLAVKSAVRVSAGDHQHAEILVGMAQG